MNRIVGTSVFLVHFRCRDFSIYYFFFFRKFKNAHKWISYFFPLRCFWAFFYFCSLICVLCFCLVLFLCFWCVQNLFVKKIIKRFKIALMTSFPLPFGVILVCIFPHSDWISECGKMRTRITPNTDTFYAVMDVGIIWWVIAPCPGLQK